MELTLAAGYILTTERAESSYGQPVLVGPSGRAYGPHDTPSEPSGDDVMDFFTESARQACASRALEIGLLAHPLVRKFLA